MRRQSPRVFFSLLFILVASIPVYPRVSKEMEAYYKQEYSNKAMFLRVPVRGDRQTVHVLEGGSSLDQSNLGEVLRFKVGEQVRITDLSFKDSAIEFKISSIDSVRRGTIIFQFRNPLRHSFASRPSFEAALKDSFTEGLSYQEIDSAKEDFVQDQFDVLLQQFAVTTGTSVDFVLEAVTQKNPKYKEAKLQLDSATQQVQELKSELQEEKSRSDRYRNEARDATGELAAMNQANQSLRAERDQVVRERRDFESKVKSLEDENRRFRQQVEEVARKLDVQTDSSSKLGQQVSSLSQVIDSLKQEREKLSGQVEGLNQKVTALEKRNGKLTSDLENSERKSRKLKSDLDELTSNRDSLEATYLTVKRNKENLERAKAFEAAIRVERSVEAREGKTYQISTLSLLTQRIAVLEVEEPLESNQDYLVRFKVESPDTVEFTPEERDFYETLGEKFRVETTWLSGSGRLDPLLSAGEALQEVAPRGEAEWSWRFEGILSEPESVTLGLRLIDVDDQVLEIANQEFQVRPSGLIAQFGSVFSWLSLGVGVLVGVVISLAVGWFRGGKDSLRRESGRKKDFGAQKRL